MIKMAAEVVHLHNSLEGERWSTRNIEHGPPIRRERGQRILTFSIQVIELVAK